MEDAVILAAVRTPIGRYAGVLKDAAPTIWARSCLPRPSGARVSPPK